MPQEEVPMPQEEVPLRFYGLVFPEPFLDAPPNTDPVKLFNFHEKDLENAGSDSLDIAKFGGSDLIKEEAGAAKYPSVSLYMPQFPPLCEALAYCPVTRSFILAGGYLYKLPGGEPIASRGVWSIKATATPPTWKFCNEMVRARQYGLAVPYVDQKIYIFGGDVTPDGITPPSLEIYDPCTGDLSGPPIVLDPDGRLQLCSYFLWKGSSAPHKKPLIMIHLIRLVDSLTLTLSQQLWSYDVEGKAFEKVDPYFPAIGFMSMKSLLLPLDRHDTLLIVDRPGVWWFYDMSAKCLKGKVGLEVEGLPLYKEVLHGFCRYSSDSSPLVYLFMDRRGCDETFPQDLTCVKFKLKIDGEKIDAVRVGQVVGLHIGENFGFHMFAAPETEPETEDLGGQGGKRKRVEGCS